MSVQSLSFWQQDQNFWSQGKTQAQASAASDALITTMGSAVTNEVRGLASIANKSALDRVNTALTAAIQSVLQQSQSGSSTSSSSSSSSTSSASGSSSSSGPAPATGIGTVPLSATTSLLTLGIPPSGTITVNDGTNTTTYASSGTDTVGDVINAINNPNVATDAQVTASLDASGHLVLTGKNDTVPISVGGVFASDVGFGPKNNSFQPVAATSSAAGPSTSSASSSSSGAGAPSTTAGNNSSTATLFNSAAALQTGGTAAVLLASGGAAGSLVNLLA